MFVCTKSFQFGSKTRMYLSRALDWMAALRSCLIMIQTFDDRSIGVVNVV